MPGLISVFRNSQSLSLRKLDIPIMLLNLFMHAPSSFANVYFAESTRNLTLLHLVFVNQQDP